MALFVGILFGPGLVLLVLGPGTSGKDGDQKTQNRENVLAFFMTLLFYGWAACLVFVLAGLLEDWETVWKAVLIGLPAVYVLGSVIARGKKKARQRGHRPEREKQQLPPHLLLNRNILLTDEHVHAVGGFHADISCSYNHAKHTLHYSEYATGQESIHMTIRLPRKVRDVRQLQDYVRTNYPNLKLMIREWELH